MRILSKRWLFDLVNFSGAMYCYLCKVIVQELCVEFQEFFDRRMFDVWQQSTLIIGQLTALLVSAVAAHANAAVEVHRGLDVFALNS